MFEKNRVERAERLPNIKIPNFEEINSLGIEWNAQLTRFGYKYIFRNAEELEGKYFLLGSKTENQVLFVTLHYNEDGGRGFLHPKSREKVSFSTIASFLKGKFPNIDNFILSICYPVYAKNFISESRDDIIILGNNDREYRVMFYKKKGVIEVIPTKSSIKNPSVSKKVNV